MPHKQPKPFLSLPKHLQPATRRWGEGVLADYALESHHFRLLVLACEAWDRKEQARAALAQHGVTYVDRFGQPRSRPEVAIERDARLAFARLVRELGLDVQEPHEARPPAIRGSAILRRVP
jgi:phage terminase small subunit